MTMSTIDELKASAIKLLQEIEYYHTKHRGMIQGTRPLAVIEDELRPIVNAIDDHDYSLIPMPEVTKSMLFSWYDKQRKIHNIILPLQNYDLTFYADELVLDLPVPADMLKKFPKGKINKWAFTQAEDPRIEWAGDWSDMGTFRLVHKGLNAVITHKKNGVQIRCERKNYGKDMWMPDKVRFDMYEAGAQ